MEVTRAISAAAATVAVLAASMFGYSRWQADRPPRGTPATSVVSNGSETDAEKMRAELAAMRREVQLVRAQVAGLQDHVGNVEKARQTAPLPAADAESDEAAVSNPAPARRTEPRDLNAIEARYLNLLDAEAVDAAWARPEQNAIRDFVARAAPDAKIEELECRSSLCRLRVRLPSETALSTFRYQIGQPPLDHGGFFHIDPENHTLTYVSPRAGSQLPDVED